MKTIKALFKKTTVLPSGEMATEGDLVCWVNSDGDHCEDILRYDKKRKKFVFWNVDFCLHNYGGLKICKCKDDEVEE